MPGASLLSLLDDITSILDDVASLTKVAARKTSGVLGDDLALNAQQVTGVRADRELPVVWAVAKGSAVNKLILVPGALVVSRFVPWLVTPLLVAGGAFLCFEGVEKVVHVLLHAKQKRTTIVLREGAAVEEGVAEKEKIRGAIRTDFVLSAEIVVITLGSVSSAAFLTQVLVLSAVAALMTVGVYGAVAVIVKLDDAGLHLSLRAGDSLWARVQRGVGRATLRAAPILMRLLSILGTMAMFLVGGGILTHGIHPLHALKEAIVAAAGAIPAIGGVLGVLTPVLVDAVAGMLAGATVLAVLSAAKAVVRQL